MDLVKVRLAELIEEGLLDERFYSRAVDIPARMISAINKADIDVCAFLRVETAVVVRCTANASEVFIPSSYVDPQGVTEVPGMDEFFTIGQIRSSYVDVFSSYPRGGQNLPLARLRIVPRSDAANDSSYEGVSGIVYFDEYKESMSIRPSFGSSTFLMFNALIRPKLIVDYSNPDSLVQSYNIKAPEYAHNAVVLLAMYELLPISSPASDLIHKRYLSAIRSAYDAVPAPSYTVRIEGSYY